MSEKMKILYEVDMPDFEIALDSHGKYPAGTPDAYRVLESKLSSAGIIVQGLYRGQWKPNPNCQALIAHLIRVMA